MSIDDIETYTSDCANNSWLALINYDTIIA